MNGQKTLYAGDGKRLYRLESAPLPAVRREHPGCAFVRKQMPQGLRTTLYVPSGRLTCITDAGGAILRPFVKKAEDLEKVTEFLRSVELYAEPGNLFCGIGPSPRRQLYSLWLQDYAHISRNAGTALLSVEKRLENLFTKKAALAEENGCRVLLIEDALRAADAPLMPLLWEGYARLTERTRLAVLVSMEEPLEMPVDSPLHKRMEAVLEAEGTQLPLIPAEKEPQENRETVGE